MAEKPEDLNLPNAVVGRIIRDALPEGVNLSKDARSCIGKASTIFILYATSCANNFAIRAKRKTITAQDVIMAMDDMAFEQFVEPLQEALEAFKRDSKAKKEATAQKVKEKISEQVDQRSGSPDDGVEIIEADGYDQEDQDGDDAEDQDSHEAVTVESVGVVAENSPEIVTLDDG